VHLHLQTIDTRARQCSTEFRHLRFAHRCAAVEEEHVQGT
jgi:hypothetical protein